MCDCLATLRRELAPHGLAPTHAAWGAFTNRLVIETYVSDEKRGRGACPVLCRYCPLCGEKYPEKPEGAP